jgi:hypothetical protein
MSKKLIVFVAILAVSWLGTAHAAVENVKVSGDITACGLARSNFDFGARNSANFDDHISAIASIIRLRFDVDLTEEVTATVRLLNERVWGSALSADNTNYDVDLDLAHITLKEFLDDRLTLIVGRQEVRLGSGMIVGDVNTNQSGFTNAALSGTVGDLSVRKAFDAIVGVIDLAPATVTLGYIKADEADADEEDDTNASLINLAYDLGDSTIGEIYFVMKDTQPKQATRDDVKNLGARIVCSPMDNLTVSGEIAYQWGKEENFRADNQRRSDRAIMAQATYAFLDQPWAPTLGIDYAYFSRNWDPMYEDLTPANIANVLLSNSNIQCIGGTLTINPREDILVKLRYANFRLVDKVGIVGDSPLNSSFATYSIDTDKKCVGDEIDVDIVYDYTEDVQMSLLLDTFLPGSLFNDENDSTAFQAIGLMKVSF